MAIRAPDPRDRDKDLLDLKYAPWTWRVQKTVIWMLAALTCLKSLAARFHRLLAEPPRKRKKQVQFPLRGLS